jgi:hypothetical protein
LTSSSSMLLASLSRSGLRTSSMTRCNASRTRGACEIGPWSANFPRSPATRKSWAILAPG